MIIRPIGFVGFTKEEFEVIDKALILFRQSSLVPISELADSYSVRTKIARKLREFEVKV